MPCACTREQPVETFEENEVYCICGLHRQIRHNILRFPVVVFCLKKVSSFQKLIPKPAPVFSQEVIFNSAECIESLRLTEILDSLLLNQYTILDTKEQILTLSYQLSDDKFMYD